MPTIYKGTMMSDDETAILYPKTTADQVILADSTAVEAKISNLQTQINGKSATGHSHDDRYHTKAAVDAGLNLKANITALDLKANNSSPVFTGNPVANGRYLSQMIIGSAVPNASTCPPGCIYGQV